MFNAIVIEKDQKDCRCQLKQIDDSLLSEGDVAVSIDHSSLNYKDGLAISGSAPIVRRWPMVAGIDFAGTVTKSTHPRWKEGDKVIANGFGLGEVHTGGLAQKARVNGDMLIKLPQKLTSAAAMAIGTAGYTAMLAVLALERAGVAPEMGSAVVTGAAGGVGSIAIALLKKRGFHVIASTGRVNERDYLAGLGADEIIDRNSISGPCKPLEKERWAAGIDNAGSHTLANLLAATSRNGAIASCGRAQGLDLPSSVAPFILRGVSLIGIDSNYAPIPIREAAWQRLVEDLDLNKLAAMTTNIKLDQVIDTAQHFLDGSLRGRIVVNVNE